jgi:lysozyme
MTIYGVDVSGYQPNFDFAQCRAQGFDFAVIKATEGSNYINPSYSKQLQASVNAGLLTCSYHFVHATDVPGQLAELERYVDRRYPVWLDSEMDGSGEYNASVQLHDQARRDGWNVVGDYFPRWFWSSIGSPNLVPLGALWSSGYPTSRTGAAVDIYAAAGGDSGSGWAAYGGSSPVLWQFTDAATVANYTRIDADAFRGTRDQLAALLQGDTMTPDELLDLPINRAGDETGVTSLRQIVAWFDSDLNGLKATLNARLDAIEAKFAAAATPTIDYDQLAAKVAAHIHLSGTVQAAGDGS